MKSRINIIAIPFLFIWELPQNLLGIVVWVVMKTNKSIVCVETKEGRCFIETKFTGVSLGTFIFWSVSGNRYANLVNDCRMHEFGHALQSAMLGPFYLIVVGIPSISRVIYSRWYFSRNGKRWDNYFNAFPENWADRLGGVIISKKSNTSD